MGRKKVATLILGLIVLLLVLRAVSRFTAATGGGAITKDAPFEYSEPSGTLKGVFQFSYEKSVAKDVYFFGDSFCARQLVPTRDTFPFLLFKKLNAAGFDSSLINVCLENNRLRRLPEMINYYIPNRLVSQPGVAFIMLGAVDYREAFFSLDQDFPNHDFFRPIENSRLKFLNLVDLEKYVGEKMTSLRLASFAEYSSNEALLADLLPLWELFWRSYSSKEDTFSLGHENFIREIERRPVLQSLRDNSFVHDLLTDKTNMSFFIFLSKTLFMTSIQENNFQLSQKILTTLLDVCPVAFYKSEIIKELVAIFLLNYPEESTKPFFLHLDDVLLKSDKVVEATYFRAGVLEKKTRISEVKKASEIALAESLALLKIRNVLPVLVTAPYDFPLFHNDELRAFARRNNVSFVDLAKLLELKKMDSRKGILAYSFMKKAGHQYVSDLLFSAITSSAVK